MAALYRGTVSHQRWAPARHGFAYEVFMVLLDLDALPTALGGGWWWPLAAVNRRAIASFSEAHHLVNVRKPGEPLSQAVRRLLAEHLPGGMRPDGRLLLLTNLAYFGYCFNPVSFYYLLSPRLKEAGRHAAGRVQAVIAEVTNTPWGQQHYYVLTPSAAGVRAWEQWRPSGSSGAGAGIERPRWRLLGDAAAAAAESTAKVAGKPPSAGSTSGSAASATAPAGVETAREAAALAALGAVAPLDFDGLAASFAPADGVPEADAASGSGPRDGSRLLRYTFAKTFHVSPFMPMDHQYEWIFNEPPSLPSTPYRDDAPDTLLVRSQNRQLSDGAVVFNAQLRLTRRPLTAWSLAWLVFVALPLFTHRVQWWIHYEAFRLWLKGISLFPHPTGATSTFTDIVAAIMVPVMWVAAAWAALRKALGWQQPVERDASAAASTADRTSEAPTAAGGGGGGGDGRSGAGAGGATRAAVAAGGGSD